jgi:hypothetical protein
VNTIFCAAAMVLIHQVAPNFKDRERHPLAPSLPRLTREEEKKIDAIIERFILYDIGKLTGAEGKKALDDFNRLGREATFQLLEGLNRAANMEASCPAVIIAKKLTSIFLTTDDVELLAFARENIGADVTAKRHQNLLQDLKFRCQMRTAVLNRQGASKSVASMSLAELAKSAAKERGPRLKAALIETEKRQGPKAVDILIMGITNADADAVKLSQGLLAKNLQHQSADLLKALLQHERRDVRMAAIQAVGAKKLRFGAELIGLVQDGDTEVSQAARRALMQLSGGLDHGPDQDASFEARATAVQRWRDWWSGQK